MTDEGWNTRLDSKTRDPLSSSRLVSLTWRILAVNIVPLLMFGLGVFYLDSYRKVLLDERYKLARIEAQITAEALAGASRERQEAVLMQIGKEQKLRLRMFDAEGRLWADSFQLDKPAFQFDTPGDENWQESFARWLDRAVDTIVGADPIPDYIEPEDSNADAWPELARARKEGLTQIQLRDAPDGTPVINAAAPVGLVGATLLTTRNAVDITEKVRAARTTLGSAIGLALLASILLSLYMARTIVLPLRTLARAAIRVRQGRERHVEVPSLARAPRRDRPARARGGRDDRRAAQPDRRGRDLRSRRGARDQEPAGELAQRDRIRCPRSRTRACGHSLSRSRRTTSAGSTGWSAKFPRRAGSMLK